MTLNPWLLLLHKNSICRLKQHACRIKIYTTHGRGVCSDSDHFGKSRHASSEITIIEMDRLYLLRTCVERSCLKNSSLAAAYVKESRSDLIRICKCASIAEVSQFAEIALERRTVTTEVTKKERERKREKEREGREKRLASKIRLAGKRTSGEIKAHAKVVNYFRGVVVNIGQLQRIINRRRTVPPRPLGAKISVVQIYLGREAFGRNEQRETMH